MKRSFFDHYRLKSKYRQAFFQQSNCALLLCNNDEFSTIIDANDAFYQLIGYSKEEMKCVHQHRFANLVIDDLSQILAKVSRSLQDNATLDYEFRIRNKQGQTLWIHDIATYDKKLNCFFVVIMDITYRQNALDAIVKTTSIDNLTRWLSSLIDNIPNPIAIFSHDHIVLANKNFQHLKTTVCAGETENCSVDHVFKITEEFDKTIRQLSQKNGVVAYNEGTITTLGNKIYRINQQILKHPFEQGEFSMLVFDDITVLQEKQVVLSQAVEARNHFLAIVSHELRTPIAAMIGLMRLLIPYQGTKESKQLLDSTLQSAQRLNLHVNDILDFSKIEADQLELDPQPIELLDELDSMFKIYQPLCQTKGINLMFHCQPTSAMTVQLDWPRTQQILNNILNNAIKFTEQGSIEVSLKLSNHRLAIEVQDSGCGMGEEHLASLYTPFQQGDKTISRRYGGTGLGLSIVKRLVDLMDGEIAISSEIGIGTKVCITIACPVEAQRQTSRTCSTQVAIAKEIEITHDTWQDQLTSTALNILVVDDDPINRLVFHKQLHSLGIHATVVSSAKHALQRLDVQEENDQVEAIDLLFTDIHMPEMDGYQLCHQIRSNHKFSHLPIIGCTADNSKEIISKSKDAGMNQMIFKPYSVELIASIISQYTRMS